MDHDLDYFFTSRDYYLHLAKGGKKFYKDIVKFVRNNMHLVEDLRKLLDPKYSKDTSNVNNLIRFIYSLLEHRRFLIMHDVVFGYQPPKFVEITNDIELEIVQFLAEVLLEDIIQGKTRILFNLPQPSNTNRPPKK
jgi:hypothetical protein